MHVFAEVSAKPLHPKNPDDQQNKEKTMYQNEQELNRLCSVSLGELIEPQLKNSYFDTDIGLYAVAGKLREMYKRHETVYWAHVRKNPGAHVMELYGFDVYILYTDKESISNVPLGKRDSFDLQPADIADVLESFLREDYPLRGIAVNSFSYQTDGVYSVNQDTVRLVV